MTKSECYPHAVIPSPMTAARRETWYHTMPAYHRSQAYPIGWYVRDPMGKTVSYYDTLEQATTEAHRLNAALRNIYRSADHHG